VIDHSIHHTQLVCTGWVASWLLVLDNTNNPYILFPFSLPAIEDIKACLKNTSLHGTLVSVFGRAIQDRLLHPGAATADIIQHYVSTIKTFQHIDPSGSQKENRCAPCIAILLIPTPGPTLLQVLFSMQQLVPYENTCAAGRTPPGALSPC
jgi:hypothetical protein